MSNGMSPDGEQNQQSKTKCFADFVKDVPSILTSEHAQYRRLQMIGSVSDVVILRHICVAGVSCLSNPIVILFNMLIVHCLGIVWQMLFSGSGDHQRATCV